MQLVVAAPEVEADGPLIEHGRGLHVAEVVAPARMRLLAEQRVEGMLDVLGQHRIAVREARLEVEPERDRQAVGRKGHRFGQQPVDRERLVIGLLGQGFEHQQVHARRHHPAQRERVELVEGAETVERERASAGGVGVDVLEVAKPWRVLGLGTPGDAVHEALGRGRGCCRGRGCGRRLARRLAHRSARQQQRDQPRRRQPP